MKKIWMLFVVVTLCVPVIAFADGRTEKGRQEEAHVEDIDI